MEVLLASESYVLDKYLCYDIAGVRHPEELSLLKPTSSTKDKDKKSQTLSSTSINRYSRTSSSSNGSLNKGQITPANPLNTPQRTTLHIQSPGVSCLLCIF